MPAKSAYVAEGERWGGLPRRYVGLNPTLEPSTKMSPSITRHKVATKPKRQKLFLPSLHMVKMIVLTGKPSYGPNNIVKPNETAAEGGHNHLFSAVACGPGYNPDRPTRERGSRLRLVKQFPERSRERRLASIRELARTHEGRENSEEREERKGKGAREPYSNGELRCSSK